MCMDAYGEGKRRDIMMGGCHQSQGHQYFRYDLNTQQIFHRSVSYQFCVEADIATQAVYVTDCNQTKIEQRWMFGFVNETNIKNWLTYGSAIEDEREIIDLKQMWTSQVNA